MTKLRGGVIMHKLVEAMRVKEGSVFDLTHHTFYERDFTFFIRLSKYLGRVVRCDKARAEEIGLLSQLIYLSSLLHVSITEETNDMEQLRAEKQMPVLLGDLLYGRFISELSETGNSSYLPIYLSYLKEFNANSIDSLEDRTEFDMKKAAFLLMVKTNEVFALVMGHNPLDILMEGELFFAEEWNVSKGEKVTNMAQLEALFDR